MYPFIFAAAAAKSLQSCPTLCDPIDRSPSGSPVPGILQARTLEWVAISFSNALLDWKWEGEKVLANRGAWGQFSQLRSHFSADPIGTPSKFSFQTQFPERNRCLGTSSKAGGGATRWPDSVVIRELSWRSVAVAEAMPQSRPISVFCPLSPLLKKVLEPHHLLAEQSVAGNQPAGEETPPQPPPEKFDAKVGPESVSSR